MTGLFEISIPEKYVISEPDLEGNETSINFNTLADKYCNNIIRRGWKVWNGDSSIHAEVKSLTVGEFLLICSFEGECKYYNPYIKISEEYIDNVIPEGLSNREYLDGDIIKVHTWRTWRSSEESYPLQLIEGNYYFVSYSFGNTLTSQELMTIYNNQDSTLVDELPTVDLDGTHNI